MHQLQSKKILQMYILLNRGEKNLDSPFKIKNIWSKVRDARHVVLYLLLARVVLCITLFSANTQPLTTLQHAQNCCASLPCTANTINISLATLISKHSQRMLLRGWQCGQKGVDVMLMLMSELGHCLCDMHSHHGWHLLLHRYLRHQRTLPVDTKAQSCIPIPSPSNYH